MQNPFTLNDDQLRTLLKSFSVWYQQNSKEKKYTTDQKEIAEQIRSSFLDELYLSKVSNDELAQKIFKYSRTLEGPAHIRLGMPRISSELERIKRNFEYIINSSDDPFKIAAEILEGDKKIPIFAKSFWSPILQARFPDVLPNWNNKTENFLKKVGVVLKTSKLTIDKKYHLLSEAFQYLQSLDPSQDFFTLNHLMHYGTVIPEGVKLLDELIGSDKIGYWQIAPAEGARLWDDLRSHNIAAVGFSEIDFNLSDMTEKEVRDLFDKHYPNHTKREADIHFRMLWNFINLKPGDQVVANKGRSLLLGLGIVKGRYKFRPERKEYKHTVDVDYYNVIDEGLPVPDNIKGKLGKTISPLNKDEFETIRAIFGKKKKSRPEIEPPVYPIHEALKDLFLAEDTFTGIVDQLRNKKNIILQGPPGVGKTFIAKRIAYSMMGTKDNRRISMIQFHQSYSYEDFIQGFRPNADGKFDIKNGIFYEFCRKVQRDAGKDYFFIIDEINRGNLSKIFGEMFMLIESDKRGTEFAMPLTYAREPDDTFFIPVNLHIIGTMNTADRSLAMVDYALRRRFSFVDLEPMFENDKFKSYLMAHKVDPVVVGRIIDRMTKLNEVIAGDTRNLGAGYRIGHSYFCPCNESSIYDAAWYRTVIKSEIEPLLKEYWFDDPDKVQKQVEYLLS